jgi:hypothetical protein
MFCIKPARRGATIIYKAGSPRGISAAVVRTAL